MGIGALLDRGGNDTYQSWVYVLGSGAHGGFGLLVDAHGDDLYQASGWNALGMAVDFRSYPAGHAVLRHERCRADVREFVGSEFFQNGERPA